MKKTYAVALKELRQILRDRRSRLLGAILAGALSIGVTLAAIYFLASPKAAAHAVRTYGVTPGWPLALAGVIGLAALAVFRVRDGWLAYGGALAGVLVAVGLVVYPGINAERSSSGFVRQVEGASADIAELGLVGAKEQYLLELRRATVNFGHARWREREQEASDAAAWYAAKPGRGVLLDKKAQALCFSETQVRDIGTANGQHWFLVTSGDASSACVAKGDLRRARIYFPPTVSTNSAG